MSNPSASRQCRTQSLSGSLLALLSVSSPAGRWEVTTTNYNLVALDGNAAQRYTLGHLLSYINGKATMILLLVPVHKSKFDPPACACACAIVRSLVLKANAEAKQGTRSSRRPLSPLAGTPNCSFGAVTEEFYSPSQLQYKLLDNLSNHILIVYHIHKGIQGY